MKQLPDFSTKDRIDMFDEVYSRMIEAEARVAELERVFKKSAIRFHALSVVKEVGEHNDTFTQCNSEICREHRTILAKGGAS